MGKRLAIVLVTNDLYAGLAAVACSSLLESSREPADLDIHILSVDLRPEFRRRLREAIERRRGTVYFHDLRLVIEMDADYRGVSPHFHRLLAPRVLPPEVERWVYLDCDVVVKGDVLTLQCLDLEGNVAAACRDYLGCFRDAVSNHEILGVDGSSPYFNSGVMVIDRAEWLRNDVSARVLACTRDNEPHLYAQGRFFQYEQYALNVVLYGRLAMLDSFWNYGSEYPFRPAGIVHFNGHGRPWSASCTREFRADFYACLQRVGWNEEEVRGRPLADPRKILIATDIMSPGGVDRYILDLARAAKQSGYAVSAALERTSASAVGDELEAAGVEVHRGCLYHRAYEESRITEESRRILGRVNPDLLHVACGAPWSCLTLRETAIAAGIATVVTEQYVPETQDLPDAVVGRISALYGAAKRLIFVSEGNRNEMRKRLAMDATRTCVIPNAVDVEAIAAACPAPADRMRRARWRQSAGELRVMVAARLTPQKGINVLIDALGLLRPDLGMRLNVFGDGPERSALEERCRQLGLASCVRFHGWSHDVVSELAVHDIFVHPSHSEGMPYAVLEAMAGGIPVIATDVPGTVEALDGGRLGRVVPRDDPGALAEALAAWRYDLVESFSRAREAADYAAAHHALRNGMARTLACWR